MAANFIDFIDRSKKLSVNNSIAEKYVLYLEGEKKPTEQSRLSYCTAVMIFLEAIDKEIQQLEIDDVAVFKRQNRGVLSDSRLNDILPQVAKFISFCKNEGLSVNIHELDILKLRTPPQEVKEKNPPKIIWPKDIMAIRQTLIEKDDIRKLTLFELLYAYGLKEEDLKRHFNSENYNVNDGTFTYKRNGKDRVCSMPEYLRKLINKAPEKVFEKYGTYAGRKTESFKNQISVTGEWSGIELKISDLTKTHTERSTKCFKCREEYPLEPFYWKLQMIEAERATSYFPICNDCAKEVDEHE